MYENIKKLIFEYIRFFENRINIEELNNSIAVSIPLLDMHNDCLEFYIEYNNDKTIHLTDDGYLLSELDDIGVSFSKKTSKRNELLYEVLNINNIKLKDNLELTKDFDISRFNIELNSFIQGMVNISNFYLLSSNNVKDTFVNDFESFLNTISNSFKKNVNLPCKSKCTITFDYQIIGKEKSKYVKVHSNSNNNALASILLWDDVSSNDKKDDSMVIVIKNDEKMDDSFYNLSKSHNVDVALWKDKNELLEKLSV